MKFLPRHLSARHLAILGMLVATLLLLLVGGLQWKSGQDYRNSLERASRARTVTLDLESLLACMLDAETGQRGYLLTHQDSYLDPYNHSLAFSRDQLQTLRQLITDPGQQERLNGLEPLMKVKFDELAQAVTLEQRGNHAGALQLVADGSGKTSMDQIRSSVSDMQDVEASLYQQREDVSHHYSQMNSELSILLLALGLACVVALVFYFLLHQLEIMQEMITICAWSKLIEFEGEWISVEEYLSRRLEVRISHGISRPEAIKMLKLLEYEKHKKEEQDRQVTEVSG